MSTAPTREHQNQGPEVTKKHSKIMKIIMKLTRKPSRNAGQKKTRFLSDFSSILAVFWIPLGPPGSTFLLKNVRPPGEETAFLRFWWIFDVFSMPLAALGASWGPF